MDFKKILKNGLILGFVLALLMVCVSFHLFDGFIDIINLGLPLWIFLILIVLVAAVINQNKIIFQLRSLQDQLNNPPEDSYDYSDEAQQ